MIDQIKLAIGLVAAVFFISLFGYVGCQAKNLANVKADLERQVAETKACNDSVRSLRRAVEEQTDLAEEYRVAGETAEALYEELAAREPAVRYVPRERIVERVRPGDCDRAALDAWDLLHGGNASWTPAEPTAQDWYAYYSSPQWGARQQNVAIPSSPVVTEFRLYATESPFPSLSPPFSGQGTWIYGQIVSQEQR